MRTQHHVEFVRPSRLLVAPSWEVHMKTSSVLVMSIAISFGCGSESGGSAGGGESDVSAGGGGIGNSPPGNNGFDVSNTPKGGEADSPDCSDAAKHVYVVSAENTLYSFAPDKLAFTKVGTITCPDLPYPVSMAIDRAGTAWLENSSGKLFKVSTSDASCLPTDVVTGGYWGMAFVTDSATSHAETLYLAEKTSPFGASQVGTYNPRLAKLDLASTKVSIIAEFTGNVAGIGAELTGTGDGRLYGFFGTHTPPTLARVDRTTSQTTEEKPIQGPDITSSVAFAFAFWGGDFWFFTSADDDRSRHSSVVHLKTSGDGSISTAMPDVGGFHIVGAGVSTCAPVAPVIR
jgi:hypothetical protein